MKRIKQLQSLSKDHHLSLVLAKKCKSINIADDREGAEVLSLRLQSDFDTLLRKHFRLEENLIFTIAQTKGENIKKLCQQLEQEHKRLEEMTDAISKGNYQLLVEFGELLHDHTRLEERQLFPMIEEQFTMQELDAVLSEHKIE